jgi:hypothetical protein
VRCGTAKYRPSAERRFRSVESPGPYPLWAARPQGEQPASVCAAPHRLRNERLTFPPRNKCPGPMPGPPDGVHYCAGLTTAADD